MTEKKLVLKSFETTLVCNSRFIKIA